MYGANVMFLFRMMANTRGFHQQLFATQRRMLGLQGTAGKVNRAFGQLSATMGFFAGVTLAQSARAYLRFNKAITDSFALLQRAEDIYTFDRMEEAAFKAARATNFAASEIADSFRYLFSAGLDSEQAIAALEATAKFGQAGLFDLNRAVDLSTDALTALDMASQDPQKNLKNLQTVMDALTHANTIANATVEQFSEALTKEAAAAARAYNIPLNEVIATLGVYADQGIKGALAGRMFSRFLRMLTSAAITQEHVFKSLRIEVFDGNGALRSMVDIVNDLTRAMGRFSPQQRAYVLKLLGFQARTQGVVLPLLGMVDQLQDKLNKMGNASGAVDRVTAIQGMGDARRLDLKMKELQERFIEMGETLVPTMEFLIDLGTGAVTIFANAYKDLFRNFEAIGIFLANLGQKDGLSFTEKWIRAQAKAAENQRAGELQIERARREAEQRKWLDSVRLTSSFDKAEQISKRGVLTNLFPTAMGFGMNPKSAMDKVIAELRTNMTEAGREMMDEIRNAAVEQAVSRGNTIRALSLLTQKFNELQVQSYGLDFEELTNNMRSRFGISQQIRSILQDTAGRSPLAPAVSMGSVEDLELRYGSKQKDLEREGLEALRGNTEMTSRLNNNIAAILTFMANRVGELSPEKALQGGF